MVHYCNIRFITVYVRFITVQFITINTRFITVYLRPITVYIWSITVNIWFITVYIRFLDVYKRFIAVYIQSITVNILPGCRAAVARASGLNAFWNAYISVQSEQLLWVIWLGAVVQSAGTRPWISNHCDLEIRERMVDIWPSRVHGSCCLRRTSG